MVDEFPCTILLLAGLIQSFGNISDTFCCFFVQVLREDLNLVLFFADVVDEVLQIKEVFLDH